MKKATELPPPPPNATLLLRLLTHPPPTGILVFDYTPRLGCSAIPPPPPPPPPKAKKGDGKGSGATTAAAAAAPVATAPVNPLARETSVMSPAFKPARTDPADEAEGVNGRAGTDNDIKADSTRVVEAITFFGDEEVQIGI